MCLYGAEKKRFEMWALAGNELPEMTICFSPVLVTLHASKHKAPADLSSPGKPCEQPSLSLPCRLAGPSTSAGKPQPVLLAGAACTSPLIRRATGETATGTEPGAAPCAKAGPEPSKSAAREQRVGCSEARTA